MELVRIEPLSGLHKFRGSENEASGTRTVGGGPVIYLADAHMPVNRRLRDLCRVSRRKTIYGAERGL